MKPLKIIAQVEIHREVFEAHVKNAIMYVYPGLNNWSDLKLTLSEERTIFEYAKYLFEAEAEEVLTNWGNLIDDEMFVDTLRARVGVLKRRMDAVLDVEAEDDKRAIERLTSRGYKVQKS